MSFTICQEVLTEQRRGAPNQALQDLQEEGEDNAQGGVRIKRIKTSRVSLPKSLY